MRSSDILIVDDDVGIRELLSEILQDEGYTVALAENAEAARSLRNQTRPAIVLLDIWMPDCDGISLLNEWSKNGQLNMPVIMMSGHASIDSAVEATKIGAFDFLEKPISLQKLLDILPLALKHSEAQANTVLSLDKIGKAEQIKDLKRQLERISAVRTPVLLLGEVGSGFESVARFFHQPNSLWLNVSKVEQLAESPLDLLQKANGGVLFLPDINQYPHRSQQGLLFLLSKLERFNVRLVCSCTVPWASILEDKEWDQRLSSILSKVVVKIPPLREHISDIALISERLLREFVEEKQVKPCKISITAINVLSQYDWPGNIDQLALVIKSLAVSAKGSTIEASQAIKALAQYRHDKNSQETGFDFSLPLRELREQLERRYFEHHILQENGNMSRVALKVGLERTHLYRKLKQLGIRFLRRSIEESSE